MVDAPQQGRPWIVKKDDQSVAKDKCVLKQNESIKMSNDGQKSHLCISGEILLSVIYIKIFIFWWFDFDSLKFPFLKF